jgi:hypothetical protein
MPASIIKKEVELSAVQKQLIQIAYLDNKKGLIKKDSWKALKSLVFSLAALYVLIFHDSFGITWLFWIILLAPLFLLYSNYMENIRNQERALLKEQELMPLLDLETVEVYECTCEKALKMDCTDYDYNVYLLEVGENQCLVYQDYYFEWEAFLPNTKFTFYTNRNLAKVLGSGLAFKGTKFMPTGFVHGNILHSWHRELSLEHLEFINYSIEGYLTKIEAELAEHL